MVTISTGIEEPNTPRMIEREDQLRDRQDDVDEARQDHIDPFADDGRGEAERDADEEGQQAVVAAAMPIVMRAP